MTCMAPCDGFALRPSQGAERGDFQVPNPRDNNAYKVFESSLTCICQSPRVKQAVLLIHGPWGFLAASVAALGFQVPGGVKARIRFFRSGPRPENQEHPQPLLADPANPTKTSS